MKKLDVKKLAQSDVSELEKKIEEIRSQVSKNQAQAGLKPEKNTRITRALRKQLAQLLTLKKGKAV